jgi:hypothetical protein
VTPTRRATSACEIPRETMPIARSLRASR